MRSVQLVAATLLATTTLATSAFAQTAPLYRNWDENGVDLVQGDFQLSFEEAANGQFAGFNLGFSTPGESVSYTGTTTQLYGCKLG